MPMRLASHRVSGKVSNIMTTKIVSGAARKAPGPPSNHAQKMNPKKRTVGEMLKPRPISIGESDVLGQYVDHYHPRDDQQRAGHTKLGQGQDHRGRHRKRQADPRYEAQEEGQDAPHQGKVNPQDQQ